MISGTPEMIRRRARQTVTRAVIAAMLALSALPVTAQQAEIPLTLNKQHLTVEVASTDAARMQGLMYRRMLPESRGMLFVFRDVALHGMWMMNTYVPLSVAFLDEQGVIINIEDMEPHTRTTHSAARPAKYALEVNRGWFAKRGIKPGMRVEGLERAPPGR